MMREKFDNDNGDAQSKAPPTVNNNNKQAAFYSKGSSVWIWYFAI